MWRSVSKLLLGVAADEDEYEIEGTSVDGENVKLLMSKEEKEVEGVVTSMFAAYGLIDSEIVFTKDVFIGSKLPLVGDKVNVRACRDHTAEAWRAIRVTKVRDCWDENQEWISDEDDAIVYETCSEAEKLQASKRREERAAERLAREHLLKEKFGIDIVSEDFGSLEIGVTKSITMEIRNQGAESQTLESYYLTAFSQQIELGPLKMMDLNLKTKSKKAQESLPMILEPNSIATLVIICQGRHLGRDSRTIVFCFANFNIGKEVTVDVTDPMIASRCSGAESKFQHVDKIGRVQNTRQQAADRTSVVIPGPKIHTSRNKHKGYSFKVHQYPVSEDLRDCILNNKDVTRILPCLRRPLTSSTYEVRFHGLLHLEEIQQEIDIREFDIEKTTMEAVNDYLSLKVPGLLEGRPSLMVGDRVIATEVECRLVAVPSYEGIVHQVLNDAVLLKFCQDFHERFQPTTLYSTTFTFNRSTFRRCHMAIDFVSKFKDEILFPMKVVLRQSQVDVFSSNQSATVVPVSNPSGRKHSSYYPNSRSCAPVKYFNPLLNTRQQMAVLRILQGQGRPTPYIIFGPPGTGKTITVVEAILQIHALIPRARILACTPSNSAADLLTERLHESGKLPKASMVRLYAALRSEEGIPELVKQYSCFVDDPDLKLMDKSIVIATCVTAGCLYGPNRRDENVTFTHVFVDEAGQATEPECTIAVGLVAASFGQVILAGDPQQLGPVLRSSIAKDLGLQISYLERMCSLPIYTRNLEKFSNGGGYDPLLITKLVDNYRSHPSLIHLSSRIFYHDELNVKGNSDVLNCLTLWDSLPNKNNFPILFHGVRGEDMREGNSPSWFNPHEVVLTVKYLSSILSNDDYDLSPDDIGVITPYKKQVEKIRVMMDKFDLPRVKVGSVEEFQGQERLAIIISTVRSSESLIDLDMKFTLGFLGNPKRFNVAITRAHALLVVIGNPHVLCQDLYWSRLVKYCFLNHAYIGCDLPVFSQDDDTFFKCPTAAGTSTKPSADVAAAKEEGNFPSIENDRNASQASTASESHLSVTSSMMPREIFDNEERLNPTEEICVSKELSCSFPPKGVETDVVFSEPKHHSSPYEFTVVGNRNNNTSSLSSIERERCHSSADASNNGLMCSQDLLDRGMIESSRSIENFEPLIPTDLQTKLFKQVEYYFGDVNLKRDAFIQEKISSNPGGWLSMEILMSFNKMKAMGLDTDFVVETLRYFSTLVQVSPDGKMIRRHPELPLEEDLPKWKSIIFQRSVVVRNYPLSENMENMQSFFESYGKISHIERGIMLKVWRNNRRYAMENCDLIVYEDSTSSKNLAKHRYSRLQKMGLKIFFMNKVVGECIDFFVARRIEKKHKNSIQAAEYFEWSETGGRERWQKRPSSSSSSSSSFHKYANSNDSAQPGVEKTGEGMPDYESKRAPFKSTHSDTSGNFHSEEVFQKFSYETPLNFGVDEDDDDDDDDVIVVASSSNQEEVDIHP